MFPANDNFSNEKAFLYAKAEELLGKYIREKIMPSRIIQNNSCLLIGAQINAAITVS